MCVGWRQLSTESAGDEIAAAYRSTGASAPRASGPTGNLRLISASNNCLKMRL